MNKYQKILASLLLALEWSTNNQGNGHSPNRVQRLKNLVEKVEQKIHHLVEEGWKDCKDDRHDQFVNDIEVGRYDRLAPVKWDEVETYNDPNGETSLEEELEQFSFDSKNFNQGG